MIPRCWVPLQGEPVSNAMLDCVVAACSQMGDIGRAFETFEAYGALGLAPDAQAFNAVLTGCIGQGITQPVPKACRRCYLSNPYKTALTYVVGVRESLRHLSSTTCMPVEH